MGVSGELGLPEEARLYGEDLVDALKRAGGTDYVVREKDADYIVRAGWKPDVPMSLEVAVYRREDWSLLPWRREDPFLTTTVPRFDIFEEAIPVEVEADYDVAELEDALQEALAAYDSVNGFRDRPAQPL